MKYKDLRDFVGRLETLGELRRVPQHVSPVLEMTELCDRVLRAGGPALLFESRQTHAFPVLGNLFGTPRRVALGMGIDANAGAGDGSKKLAVRRKARIGDAIAVPIARVPSKPQPSAIGQWLARAFASRGCRLAQAARTEDESKE